MNDLFYRLIFVVTAVLLMLSHSEWSCTAQEQRIDTINTILEEDYLQLEYHAPLTQLIKPACPSILPSEFSFPEVPVIIASADGLKELWLRAASQPEKDLRYDAVIAIAKAHSRGFPGFEDTASRLVEMLDSEETDHVLRLAIARTLIILNARDSAPVLRKYCSGKLDLAKLIEPALAEWNDAAMHSVWLSRLTAKTVRPGLLILAIRAATKTGLSEATSPIREIMLDRTLAPHVRLEAARALSSLGADDSVSDARTLMSDVTSAPFLTHLLAAHLLARQESDDAVALLKKLAKDPQPATRAIALSRLIELDPQLATPMLDDAVQHNDAKLRTIAGQALFRLQTPEGVTRLSQLLDDVHPQVRSSARQWMIEFDENEELTESMRESAMQMLASDGPRGLAQASIVLGTIDHLPAANRLVELLEHEAPDVAVASAWALRRLAVPETAAAAFEHLRQEVEDSLIERPAGGPSLEWKWDMYEQHKHLIELMGLLQYQPADELFRLFLPFPPNPPPGHPFTWIHCTHRRQLRSRAIWALGHIHEGAPPEDLVSGLVDTLTYGEEVSHVAAMSALALGRMKATSAETVLLNLYQPDQAYTQLAPARSIRGVACRAALEQITGETLPPMEIEPFVTPNATAFFLEPLDE